jgi:integrase
LGAKCPELAADAKHGSWGFYFRCDGRQHRKHGFTSKRAAQSAEAKLRTQLDAGTFVEPSKKTVGEYAAEVIERGRANGLWKPTTLVGYRRYVEQDIRPSRLGQMRFSDNIRRVHVNAWVAELTDAGRGAVTVRRALAVLRMIFSIAVRDELLQANPAFKVDLPAVPDGVPAAWELGTIGEFLQRCSRHRLGSLYEAAIYTGLRRGELAGLHWGDVDLAARTVTVRHNRVTVAGRVQEQTTTKTRAGRRSVPLSDAATASLLEWQLRQEGERAAAAEAWRGDGHVWTMEDGRALDPSYITREFQTIRKQPEPLPELRFHGLRHCAASLLIAGGGDLSTVSKLLGHSSVSVTADIYAHLIAGVGQRAVENAAALLLTHRSHERV